MPGNKTTDAIFALRMLIKKVQKMSKTALLSIGGPRESLRQGFERRAVLLYEKIRTGGKLCATCTR